MVEWSKDHVAAIGSLKTQHFGFWLKFVKMETVRGH
jgi:hypothetical protein